jgi:hypothetical protein
MSSIKQWIYSLFLALSIGSLISKDVVHWFTISFIIIFPCFLLIKVVAYLKSIMDSLQQRNTDLERFGNIDNEISDMKINFEVRIRNIEKSLEYKQEPEPSDGVYRKHMVKRALDKAYELTSAGAEFDLAVEQTAKEFGVTTKEIQELDMEENA